MHTSTTIANKLLPEHTLTPLVDMNRYPLPDDGVHANTHIVKNVTMNAAAYNRDRFPDALDLRYGFPDGHSVPVTYFQLQTVSTIDQSQPVDMTTGTVHPNHRSYLKINAFELFMEKELEFNYTPSNDGGETTCEGTAFTLPGFKPTKGDMFFYMLNDGQWGIMAVREVERLSISSGAYHRISFSLHDYLTVEFQRQLEEQTNETAYYERVSFFTQKFTLLSHESYRILQLLQQLRAEMADWYMRRYWDQSMGSIVHPEGWFDPYLVAYLQQKISIKQVHRRPKQLYSRLYDYDSSIWYPLTQGSRPRIDQCIPRWRLRTFVPSFWAGDITSLADQRYVRLGEYSKLDIDYVEYRLPADELKEEAYACRSHAFYAADETHMSAFEILIYRSIVGDTSPAAVYACTKDYYDWHACKAFYDIPFSLSLIDTGIYQLGR